MCSQRETKLPLPRFLCLLERWDLRMFGTDGLNPLLLFKFILFFTDCWSEKSSDGSGDSRALQRRLLSWYLLTSKCPQLCGRDGAGLGTICDNCDDNDILVCNVCVHTVSRVKTLNTRWWGSGGHWGSAPRVSTSSPAPLSFLTQLRSETTQPTASLARCWYKLNVIPSQGSVINYPGLSCICVAFPIKFLSSSSQQTIIWFVTPSSSSGLNYNKIGSQFSEHFSSVSIIRRVHLLFMRNICSILLPSSCHHSISHFLWPSCRVCDTFHSRIAPGPQHPLADIFHLLRNFYQSSPLPCALCASAHANSQPPAPLAELSLRDH